MLRKKSLWPLLFSLLLAGLLPKAGAAPATQTDPQAAPVVRALEAHYHGLKTLQAAFLERYSDGQKTVQLESGTVYFSRPGRMRWEYESPETKLFLADGKTVWFFVPADRTATRAPVRQSADWRTPLALLMGKAKLEEICDRIEMTSGRPGVAGNVVLSCLPRGERRAARATTSRDASEAPLDGPQSDFDRVLLEIDPVSGALADVRVMEPGGVELDYRFGNWRENLPLAESLFRFEPPRGVAIVDQPSAANP